MTTGSMKIVLPLVLRFLLTLRHEYCSQDFLEVDSEFSAFPSPFISFLVWLAFISDLIAC